GGDDEEARARAVVQPQPAHTTAVAVLLRHHVGLQEVRDGQRVASQGGGVLPIPVALVWTEPEPLDALEAGAERERDAEPGEVVIERRDRDGLFEAEVAARKDVQTLALLDRRGGGPRRPRAGGGGL